MTYNMTSENYLGSYSWRADHPYSSLGETPQCFDHGTEAVETVNPPTRTRREEANEPGGKVHGVYPT